MKACEPFNLFERKFPVDLGTALFYDMWLAGVILDARAGGMIYPKGLAETGVPLIRQSGTRLEFSGYAVGGCFVMNPDATSRNLNRLKAIAASLTKPTMPEDEVPDITRILAPIAQPYNKFLWIRQSQMVIE